jgi:predicted aconitase
MRLTDQEKRMREGGRGSAVRKTMDLLARYGQAPGAEMLVATNNVTGTINASMPSIRKYASSLAGMD